MTVSADQRAALARAVSGLRRIFETDYATLAQGKFGIHLAGRRAGVVEDVAAPSLSAHDRAARNELVGVIEYLREEGLGAREAVERLVREAVFTTVNRLLAIRVAEAIGVLSPSLVDGIRSEGFAEAVEIFPLLRDADDSGGYWTYLQTCGDELSHAVPRLFDRRHPLSSLVPSADALNAAVVILSSSLLAEVWVDPEALGWSYQFFNSMDERRAMRDASSAPRDSRELAVRNQFFTPAYVVDFLVQNTLGRRLRESSFMLDLPLLLGDVDPDAALVDLNDLAVLDPAVGSGHFLLGAYELMERAWKERGVAPEEAAPLIIRSLYGIEIDPRAAQVAQAVLYLRARRSSPNIPLDSPAIVTARPLPNDRRIRDQVLSTQSVIVRDLFDELSTALERAPDLGSLLKVEDVVMGALGERAQRPQLGDDLAESVESIEASVITVAREIADNAEATPAERLFAADAADALRFVEACSRRYDAVLMNPPFGEPIPGTKDYIKAAWPWIPWKDHNILAAFVGRGLELLKPGGYLGAITSRVGFFLVTYQAWREEVVVPRIRAMADLGHGVMEEALVEAAAYVLGKERSRSPARFRRLLKAADKESAMYEITSAEIFDVESSDLALVPGSPMSYWVSDEIRGAFSDCPPTDPTVGTAAQGLISGDDFRFVRLWWEPDSRTLGTRWLPFAKGGEYLPYFADIHLVVDWEDDGARIRATGRHARVQGTQHYFRPGFTWPERTASSASFGPLPRGAVFSAKGPAITGEAPEFAANVVLNSRLYRTFVDLLMAAGDEAASGTAARDYTVGAIKSLPYPAQIPTELDEVGFNLWEVQAEWQQQSNELSRLFNAFKWERDFEADVVAPCLDIAYSSESLVFQAYGLNMRGPAQVDDHQGPHPASYPMQASVDKAEFSRIYSLSIEALVDEALSRLGGARHLAVKSFVLDRRIELMAHMFRTHPKALIELRRRLGIDIPGLGAEIAEDRISYLLGVSFGRWDVIVGRGSSPEPPLGGPFDPLPVSPAGMLVDASGFPARMAPPGYPLALPDDRILHDDPGHPSDVVTAIERSADELFPEPDQILKTDLAHLGGSDLRALLRSRFFRLHLSRYSKSRRKAPIYWYLAVPSKEWGLWVYAPWLSREQLFAISRAALDKLRRLRDHAAQLRREVDNVAGRDARVRLEATEDLIREIEVFHEEAESVAQSGWEPDLNDGIILNAAPLEALFADATWRGDINNHRKRMQQGEYPWATVQREYFDRLKR